MNNVAEFPSNYQAEVIDSLPLDLTETHGYEQHQEELRDWLSFVSQQDVTHQEIHLEIMAARYGFPPIDRDKRIERAREFQAQDPRAAAFDLQNDHINIVIGSPVLSLYQKVDLLTISAQALNTGKLPADGRLMVLRNIKGIKKLVDGWAKQDNITGSQWHTDTTEHLETMGTLVGENLPKLSRREFFKQAASTIKGKEVKTTLGAISVVAAEVESPNPKEVEAINRAIKDKKIRKAERRVFDAIANLSKIREEEQ